MRNRLRHHCNPLHLYCRLLDIGVRRLMARRLCALYSRVYFKVL